MLPVVLCAVAGAAVLVALAETVPRAERLVAVDVSEQAYQQPIPLLSPDELSRFAEGKEAFRQHWVVAPSILGLWGRGPTSNGEACTDCHDNGGRGRPPASRDDALQSMLVRLSIPGVGQHGAPRPVPGYGDQLQEQGILGRVPPEGHAVIAWSEIEIALADGERVQLRRPQVEFRELAFGPLPSDVLVSARIAPALVGVGLIDAIPADAILAQERRQAALGLRGRANRVWDLIEEREAVGRFGHKANQPSLKQQVVTAYHADLGVTSRWFPVENCPDAQAACRAEPPGSYVELPDAFLDPLLFYLRALAPPAQRGANDASTRRGEQLFDAAGCSGCHVRQMEIAIGTPSRPTLHETIRPYTDLLLHDMGEALADGRPDFAAGPRDWRTAPLWGLGLSASVNGNTALLHDGRARSVIEAILWHDGEAQRSRDTFAQLSKADRDALIAFLHSL